MKEGDFMSIDPLMFLAFCALITLFVSGIGVAICLATDNRQNDKSKDCASANDKTDKA